MLYKTHKWQTHWKPVQLLHWFKTKTTLYYSRSKSLKPHLTHLLFECSYKHKCKSPDVSVCASSPARASAASPASQSCVPPSASGACCVCRPSSSGPSQGSCPASYTPRHPASAGDTDTLYIKVILMCILTYKLHILGQHSVFPETGSLDFKSYRVNLTGNDM